MRSKATKRTSRMRAEKRKPLVFDQKYSVVLSCLVWIVCCLAISDVTEQLIDAERIEPRLVFSIAAAPAVVGAQVLWHVAALLTSQRFG